MPIPKELRHLYGRRWQEEVRPRILKRDGNRCGHCGKPGGAPMWTYRERRWIVWMGILLPDPRFRLSQIQIGVAHLNHVSGDDRDENLLSLCRRCHLAYDARFHKFTRSGRKDQRRPLLIA